MDYPSLDLSIPKPEMAIYELFKTIGTIVAFQLMERYVRLHGIRTIWC